MIVTILFSIRGGYNMSKDNVIYTVLPLDLDQFLETDDEIMRDLEKRDPEYAKRMAEIGEILDRNKTIQEALDYKVVAPFTEDDVRDLIRLNELRWMNNIPEHAAFYHADAKNAIRMFTEK